MRRERLLYVFIGLVCAVLVALSVLMIPETGLYTTRSYDRRTRYGMFVLKADMSNETVTRWATEGVCPAMASAFRGMQAVSMMTGLSILLQITLCVTALRDPKAVMPATILFPVSLLVVAELAAIFICYLAPMTLIRCLGDRTLRDMGGSFDRGIIVVPAAIALAISSLPLSGLIARSNSPEPPTDTPEMNPPFTIPKKKIRNTEPQIFEQAPCTSVVVREI
ncbi:hypothetical protein DIPPA_22761 [Diplonema papillatum]|nr:hypothetical protein DIPPA_22761 [Diplonema papillatum]